MLHARFAPKDGDTKPCPQCRSVLVFNSRHPVLSAGLALASGAGLGELRYERAWVCGNGGCDYRELLGDAV